MRRIALVAVVLVTLSSAWSADTHLLMNQDFESPTAEKCLSGKSSKITSPGAENSRRAVARHHKGKYCDIALQTDVRYSEKLFVSFDYRVVVHQGKVPYIGIKVTTSDGKIAYTSKSKPAPEWQHYEGRVADFRLSKKTEKPLAPSSRITAFSVYGRGENDQAEHTLTIDNVRFFEKL